MDSVQFAGARRRGWFGSIVFAAVLIATARPAVAEQIEFRFSGVGSGAAGTRSFTNAPFTITAVGDTANVVAVSSGISTVYSVEAPAVINITGIGSGRITTSTRVFENDLGGVSGESPTLGLSRMPHDSGSDLLNLVDPSVTGYRLATPLGPIFEPDPHAVEQFNGVGSELGLLTFTGVDSFTFQAIVPEPAGLLLLPSTGLVLRRRRR